MDIRIGSQVETTDGKTGHVQRVVIDPSTRQVTFLIIRLGWLAPRDVVVPIRMIEQSDGSRILLNIDQSELENMPDYIERHFVAPQDDWEWPEGYPDGTVMWLTTPTIVTGSEVNAYAAGFEPLAIEEHENIPEDSTVIQEGMKVLAGGQEVGEVTNVVFKQATEQVTSIVVTSPWVGGSKEVPVDDIENVKEGKLFLSITASDLLSLPDAGS